MKLKDAAKNIIAPEMGRMMRVPSLYGEFKVRKNWLLKEKGVFDRAWEHVSISGKGVVDRKINFDTLKKCYDKIPKVFRAVNMRAEFAVQGGFKLIGEEQDVEKLQKWIKKVHLDNILLSIVRNMLIYGDVFIEIIGDGENIRLVFLPVKQIRIRRKLVVKDGVEYFSHEIDSYIQVNDVGKTLNEWKVDDENIIHFKWNWDGIEPYGTSEIKPALTVLSDKLDVEAVIPRILKFHADPRIIYRGGRPESPYNKNQLKDFVSELEERVVGGDVAVPGDVEPVPISPIRGAGELIELMNHIESQVDLCLNNPVNLFFTGKADGQTSMIVMDSIERDVKTIQDIYFPPFEQLVFTKILGKEDVPTAKPNPMNIETFLRMSRTLRQLVGKKQERVIFTPNEARKELGMGDIDEKVVQKIYDQEQPMPAFGGEDNNEPGEKIQPDGKKDGGTDIRRGQKPEEKD